MNEEAPKSTKPQVTEKSIEEKLREILPMMNADTATLKIVMQKLAIRFGMEFVDLKMQWRPQIKALLPDMLELCQSGELCGNDNSRMDADIEDWDEGEAKIRFSRKRTIKKRHAVMDASDEEQEDAEDSSASNESKISLADEGATQLKRVRTTSRTKRQTNKKSALPTKKAKATIQSDPMGLASLKQLGRAAGVLNPQVYKYLKRAKSTKEAEELLRKRLSEADITFHGSYPTSHDISVAKKQRERQKELEGIDTNLIISSGRPRRGGARHISYKEARISGEDDIAEVEQDGDEGSEKQLAASDSELSEATI